MALSETKCDQTVTFQDNISTDSFTLLNGPDEKRNKPSCVELILKLCEKFRSNLLLIREEFLMQL